MMSNQIVPFEEVQQIGKAMVDSGYFSDSKNAAQAIVKVMAGRELGLGAFASMTGIHIIQGKPALGANLLASLIKNDPRYDYRVIELTDAKCEIIFTENGEGVGRSTFTKEDAKKCGTKNMDKFARNMLFARAISNGAKWYTPGIFGGAPVYTPEELGADTDIDGNIIDVTPTVTRPTNNTERLEALGFEPEAVKEKQLWPDDLITDLLEDFPTLKARQHVINTLDLSNLAASCEYSEAENWITEYRLHRGEGMTSEAAAETANESTGLIDADEIAEAQAALL
jgi:hypothetical protein